MSQLVLGGMREQGWGRIVNVGSMGGKLTFPGGGIYSATKYAVEAISDAMRFEHAVPAAELGKGAVLTGTAFRLRSSPTRRGRLTPRFPGQWGERWPSTWTA